MYIYLPLTAVAASLGLLASVAHGQSLNLLTVPPSASSAASSQNVLTVTITGDRNGGAGLFSPRISNVLTPGLLSQDGIGNALSVNVIGDDNVFAAAQTGSDNRASIEIIGAANQALISQTGIGNVASITQTGIGNVVAIRQRGR